MTGLSPVLLKNHHDAAIQYEHTEDETLAPVGRSVIFCVCVGVCVSLSRVWGQQTTTPRLLPTTPCWCLTTRAAVQPPAQLARSTPSAQGTRTTTTSTTGALASRSWPTSTEEGTTTESGEGGWVGLRQGLGEAGPVGWTLLETTGRGRERDEGSGGRRVRNRPLQRPSPQTWIPLQRNCILALYFLVASL